MTIREAKNEIIKLNNDLKLYKEKKQINFLKTQPKASKLKDIVSSGSFVSDKFLHYVINDEKLDDKIYYTIKEINFYENYINEEIKRMSNNKENGYIVYLRDELRMGWNKISRYTNYSERQCQRLYNQAKQFTNKK